MENHKNIMKKFAVVSASALLVMSLGGGAVNAVHTNVHAESIEDMMDSTEDANYKQDTEEDTNSILVELKKDPEDWHHIKENNEDVYKAHKSAFAQAKAISDHMTPTQVDEAESDDNPDDNYQDAINKAEKSKAEKKANDASIKKHNQDVKRDPNMSNKKKPSPKKAPSKKSPKSNTDVKKRAKNNHKSKNKSNIKPTHKVRRHTRKARKHSKRASIYKQIRSLRRAIRRMQSRIDKIEASL